MISPNHTSDEMNNSSAEEKIDFFEDRTRGWYLNWAKKLRKKQHAGFAVLQILFSYFEAIMEYKTGTSSAGKSEKYFKDGFLEVFPEVMNRENYLLYIGNLYHNGRCGIYHSGATRAGVLITNGEEAVSFDIGNINIDLAKFTIRFLPILRTTLNN